ncbi:hypothetical protein D3C78_1535860 [compost metagenome]
MDCVAHRIAYTFTTPDRVLLRVITQFTVDNNAKTIDAIDKVIRHLPVVNIGECNTVREVGERVTLNQ